MSGHTFKSVRSRDWGLFGYCGGMAAASAFHEFSHHEVGLSTVVAVLTATVVLALVCASGAWSVTVHAKTEDDT